MKFLYLFIIYSTLQSSIEKITNTKITNITAIAEKQSPGITCQTQDELKKTQQVLQQVYFPCRTHTKNNFSSIQILFPQDIFEYKKFITAINNEEKLLIYKNPVYVEKKQTMPAIEEQSNKQKEEKFKKITILIKQIKNNNIYNKIIDLIDKQNNQLYKDYSDISNTTSKIFIINKKNKSNQNNELKEINEKINNFEKYLDTIIKITSIKELVNNTLDKNMNYESVLSNFEHSTKTYKNNIENSLNTTQPTNPNNSLDICSNIQTISDNINNLWKYFEFFAKNSLKTTNESKKILQGMQQQIDIFEKILQKIKNKLSTIKNEKLYEHIEFVFIENNINNIVKNITKFKQTINTINEQIEYETKKTIEYIINMNKQQEINKQKNLIIKTMDQADLENIKGRIATDLLNFPKDSLARNYCIISQLIENFSCNDKNGLNNDTNNIFKEKYAFLENLFTDLPYSYRKYATECAITEMCLLAKYIYHNDNLEELLGCCKNPQAPLNKMCKLYHETRQYSLSNKESFTILFLCSIINIYMIEIKEFYDKNIKMSCKSLDDLEENINIIKIQDPNNKNLNNIIEIIKCLRDAISNLSYISTNININTEQILSIMNKIENNYIPCIQRLEYKQYTNFLQHKIIKDIIKKITSK
jgi:hypothetical protein